MTTAQTSTQFSSTSSKSNAFASFKWDTFDKLFDEAFTPRNSTGTSSDPAASRSYSPEPSRHSHSHHTRSRSAAPPTTSEAPLEQDEFDRLWNDARRVRRTTTTRKRIVQHSDSADTDPDVDEMGKLRQRKSRNNFTETEHNGIVTLVFELPGIPKTDVKVKFSTQKITVAWQKTTVEEKSEGERLIRERVEKKFLRTIPIPSAVPFDTVRAVLQDERLTITYPRVEILV